MFDTQPSISRAATHGLPPALDDTILDLLPAAVYVCGADGILVRHNRKAAELWGREPVPGDAAERFCGSFRLYWSDGRPLAHHETPMADTLRSGRPHRNVEVQVEQPGGRRLWVLVNIDPIRNAAGELTGAINCFQDITARKLADERIRESERRLREVLEALPTAVYTTDAEGHVTFYNRASVTLSGRRPELGTDRWCISWRLYQPDGTRLPHAECPMAVALRENRAIEGAEIVAERPDGQRLPCLAYPTPLRDSAGKLVGAVNMLVDISERKRAEERRQLLIRELNHRVKNTLATVQSIAAQSFRREARSEAHQRFEGRLITLSRAHDVLTRESWEGAELHDIVAQAMEPLCGEDEDRLEIGGPELRLRPKMALSLAMALHELCTNAAKYGALSNEAGRVGVTWRIEVQDQDRRLHLRWAESGGPPVEVPQEKGFGSRLIERGLAWELGAVVRLEFPPSGVVCEIAAPLP
ncbi:HWE histidine kinase domain-containing protein [Geminicoccaceae bacterium 1502E]|nr:HWE histidine kinase domain-containing protein [Geminicoccaceae bacterium 1502E]